MEIYTSISPDCSDISISSTSLFSEKNKSSSQNSLAFASTLQTLTTTLSSALSKIQDSAPSYYSSCFDVSFSESDKLHFGMLWYLIKHFMQSGEAYDMIAKRRDELLEQKEHWRPCIEKNRQAENKLLYDKIDRLANEGKLFPVPAGCGSAYFLHDQFDAPQFVVKPVDEDILCLNNRKGLASPFHHDEEIQVRDGLPLYRSAQTDAFCYEVARLCNIASITPATVMDIISSKNYYDISHQLEGEEKEIFLMRTGLPDHEKLCSVQAYIHDSDDLYHILHQLQKEDDETSLINAFDQKDIEEAAFFTWLTADTDAHAGNFRAYIKSHTIDGKPIYGLMKIDNGLTFSEINTPLHSVLQYFPTAKYPLSAPTIDKILSIPLEDILKKMDDYELANAKSAFIERVRVLQELVGREQMSIEEIYVRLSLLGLENGKTLALTTERPLSELKSLLYGSISDYTRFTSS